MLAKLSPSKWPASIAAVETRPWSWLKPFARNPRVHPAEHVDLIRKAIRRWGWTIPVLATEDGTIIAGHGRVLAAKAEKIKNVPVVIAAGWSEQDVRAYCIADNKLTEAADWNKELLALELKWLTEENEDPAQIGFSPVEVGAIMAALERPGAFLDDIAQAMTPEAFRSLTDNVKLQIFFLAGEREEVIAWLNRERDARALPSTSAALVAIAQEAAVTPAPKAARTRPPRPAAREAPARAVATKPLDWLKPFPTNARIHSAGHVADLARSIRRFGWTIPVLCDEDGTILAGHGRVLAAKKIGLAEVPVIIAAGWSEADKRAYVLADNKLTEAGEWNAELLAEELSWLALRGEALTRLGFAGADLEKVIGAIGDGLSAAERERIKTGVALVLIMFEAERAAVLQWLEVRRAELGVTSNAEALLALARAGGDKRREVA